MSSQSAGCCPNCGNREVRQASGALQHHWRNFVGSRRRYCPKCEKKWIDTKELERSKVTRPAVFLLTVLVLFLSVRTGFRLVRREERLKEYAAAMERGDIKAIDRVLGTTEASPFTAPETPEDVPNAAEEIVPYAPRRRNLGGSRP